MVDSSSSDRGSKSGPAAHVLGRLRSTPTGWRLEVAGRKQVVRVVWARPESLEGRLLRWEYSEGALGMPRARPTTVQPAAIVAKQPDGRLPRGLRAGATRRDEREAAEAAEAAADLREQARRDRADERRKADDRLKRADAVVALNRLSSSEARPPPKPPAKRKPTMRVCSGCKKSKSIKMDFAHPRTSLCLACTTRTKKRGSVWTVASAGSPGLGKRR